MMQNSQSVLWPGKAADCDMATLLGALLRAAKVPARYVRGVIFVTDEQAKKWTGGKTSAVARRLLWSMYPSTTELENGIRMRPTWVEACVDTGQGPAWVALAPSFKFKQYQPGLQIPKPPFDRMQFLSLPGNRLATEVYMDQVPEYLRSQHPGSDHHIMARLVHSFATDEHLMWLSSDQTLFYHADALGSVIALTDAAGTAVQSYAYDSLGRLLASGEAFRNPYGFTGRELDPESGLYHYRARYYDPVIGRFLTRDPLGLPEHLLIGKTLYPRAAIPAILMAPELLNAYSYAGNSSVNWTDPTGLFVDSPWDAFWVSWDLVQISQWNSGTRWWQKALDVGALALDVAAAAIPLTPAGVGLLNRSWKIGSSGVQFTARVGYFGRDWHVLEPLWVGFESSVVRVGEKYARSFVHTGFHTVFDAHFAILQKHLDRWIVKLLQVMLGSSANAPESKPAGCP